MSIKNLFEGDRKRVNRLLSDTGSVNVFQVIDHLKNEALAESSVSKLKQIKSDILFLYSFEKQASRRHEVYSAKIRKMREEIQGL